MRRTSRWVPFAAGAAIIAPLAISSFHQWGSHWPPPTPSPSPVVAPIAISTWSAPDAYPPSSWRPFSPNSVWNTAIGPSPSPNPSSDTYQSFYSHYFPIQSAFGYKNETQQFQHPVYYGRSSDPVYSVACYATWATCVGDQKFHIPSYAIPAEGGDRHMSVIDQTNGLELDMWEAPHPSGTGGSILAASAGSGPITGPGVEFGTTGAGFPLTAGVITASEMIAGRIDHALFLVAPCTSNDDPVKPSVYRKTDTACPNNAGVPYGSRFRLNMTDSQVSAIKAPSYKIPIYRALADYGAYQGDTNGNYAFTVQFEADEMYTAPGYKNPSCPRNGAPCTPLTAYFHSQGDPGWDGTAYRVPLNEVDWQRYGQWLQPPG